MKYGFLCFAGMAVLAGCDESAYGQPDPGILVTRSVASQALGRDAYSIDPFSGNNIRTPGIYNVRVGQAKQICENDTSQILKIANMRRSDIADETRNETIEDVTVDAKLSVTVLGQTWDAPYRKIKVRDYHVDRVFSGDSRSPEDWILDHVAEKCRNEILPTNKPYIVVTSVATAKHVETVSGGGEVNFSWGIGPAVIQGEIAPYADLEARNRVFAVAGRLVPADER